MPGAMHPVGFWHSSAEEDVVTLSGQTIYQLSDDPDDAYASLKVDNNGNVYESERTISTPTWTQIDSANDWVRPAGSAPGLYEVRWSLTSGPSLYSSTVAASTWHDMSSGDFILVQRETSADQSNDSLVLIEIRYDGGSVLDSGSYRLWAEVVGLNE